MSTNRTPPTWTYEPADTLISGDVRCRVWFTSLGTWAAASMFHGTSSAAYNVKTAEDAKAWCEQQ